MRAMLLASAALAALPSFAAAQTVRNDQVQLRGVSADMDVAADSVGEAGASALAGANVFNANSTGADVVLDSFQRTDDDGHVSATIAADLGEAEAAIVMTSSATANALTGSAAAGDTDVLATQWAHTDTTAAANVTTGNAGDSASSAAASGNVAAISAAYGEVTADLYQDTTGAVAATADAAHENVAGQAVADALASANNISAVGATTTFLSGTRQYATGEAVRAEVSLSAETAGDAIGAATANGNALTIDNVYGYVDMGALQNAQTDVSARATVTLGGDFLGFASSSAYGVGNSASISNAVSDTLIDVTQYSSGDISAEAALNADGAGGQALASAAAYGNLVTGALCAFCDNGQPGLNAINDQRNEGAVHAAATINAQRARQAAGTASAIGNAATYQVTGY